MVEPLLVLAIARSWLFFVLVWGFRRYSGLTCVVAWLLMSKRKRFVKVDEVLMELWRRGENVVDVDVDRVPLILASLPASQQRGLEISNTGHLSRKSHIVKKLSNWY